MNREEFDRECQRISKDYHAASVTDEMFSDINFVYTWYPTVSETEGKQQIAYLYITFGFAIIQDMHDRAREALKIDHEIARARERLRRREDQQSQLRNGIASKSSASEWSYPTDLMPR